METPPPLIHVLVVEDDQPIALMLQTILQMENYTTTAVGTAEAALHMLTESSRAVGQIANNGYKADLILLDLQLPDMDGSQMIQRLRDTNTSIPPVIVTSAQSQDIVRRLADEIGAAGVVNKPYQIHDLLTTIQNVLDKHPLS